MTEFYDPASLEELTGYAELAYKAALVYYNGQRNTCVMTSSALAEFLRQHDLDASLVRIEAHTFGPHRLSNCGACAIGSSGDGSRRRAAPGKWNGHLGVEVAGYVLDPTIGQSDVLGLPLLVFEAAKGWEDGETQFWQYSPGRGYTMSNEHKSGDITGYHMRYYTQRGWKSLARSGPVDGATSPN